MDGNVNAYILNAWITINRSLANNYKFVLQLIGKLIVAFLWCLIFKSEQFGRFVFYVEVTYRERILGYSLRNLNISGRVGANIQGEFLGNIPKLIPF